MPASMHDGWFFPFGGLLFILLAVLVIAATYLWARRQGPPPGRSNALDILDERLARGEISEDEHARLTEVLRG